MKLQTIINSTFDEELALINKDTNNVIVKGDYYHDKINEYIEGFLHGLNFANVDYELLEDIEVSPKDELFELCDFYNDELFELCDFYNEED